jgi:NAD(P)-dependent dehydrogenase (short-subunit alcohol dehydrogenase family)
MKQVKPVGEQVVVLMGASSGIGRESALRFARKGARVVVSARGEEGLDSLVEEKRDGGGEVIAVPADTSEFEQVKAVADRAVEEYERLDTWVHLAAVGLFATFEETTPEEFERVVDVNLTGRSTGRWPRSRT